MQKPQFTCLMTCYNQEHYIYEALDSLLAQDYENIQLILMDDGSREFHTDEVKKYIETHKRSNLTDVVVSVNPENMGAIKTYNRALPWVTGKYLHVFDGDDVYYDEHTVSRIVESFASLPETEYVVASQMLMCGEKFDEWLSWYCDPSLMEAMNQMTAQQQFMKCSENVYYPKGSLVFRTDLFLQEGGYDEEFLVIDDWPTFLRTLHNGHKIWYFDFVTCKHRFGGISSTQKMTPRKARFLRELVMVQDKYVLPYVNDFPLEQQMRVFDNYRNCSIGAQEAEGIANPRLSGRFFCRYSKAYTRYYWLTVLTKLIEAGAGYGLQLAKYLTWGALAFLAVAFIPQLSLLSHTAGWFAQVTGAAALVVSWGALACKAAKLFPLPH